MSEMTEEIFRGDIAKHQMIVVRDEGVHRHISFKEPGTGIARFDLITWPNHLCYTGDMGTYVFQRTEDMFQFFRTDRRPEQSLKINLSYWSEKLIAVDSSGRHGGSAVEFDPDKFRRVINDYRISWMRRAREAGINKEVRRELWESADNIIFLEYGEDRQTIAAYDFQETIDGINFYFPDLFEHNWTRYTSHFIWCCYAIAWGIAQYDAAKPVLVQ